MLNQGETYISEELNLQQLTAKVRKEDVNYYTEVLKNVDVAIKKTFDEKQNGVKVGLGELASQRLYSAIQRGIQGYLAWHRDLYGSNTNP